MTSDGVVIQHLVMPSGIVEGEIPLYNGSGIDRGFPVELEKGEVLDLRSHFNLLPIGKLRSNTNIKNVILLLRFTGSLSIRLSRISPGRTTTESHNPVDGEGISIDITEGDLIGIEIEAAEDSVLRSGGFSCTPDSIEDIHLFHVICTYRREEKLRSKLDRISEFLETHSEMKPHYETIVIDNGCSFEYDGGDVRIIRSPNLGGSGGFARGMMESLKNNNATHILLNDDDALLDPEVIFRTISFYSLLRKDLSDTMLGGTLLFQDDSCIVQESGARFEESRSVPLKHRLDLSLIESNMSLDRDESIDYLGWWYMAMPVETVRGSGYPLPLFFKNDDVEYGLRTDSRKTTMCGITAWHPPLENRSSNIGRYHIERNRLVLLACERRLSREVIDKLVEKALIDIACLRYQSADAVIEAIGDFLKGPDHVFGMHSNGIKNIEEYDIGDIQTLRGTIGPGRRGNAPRIIRMITLNGALLPSSGGMEARFDNRRTEDFFRIGKVLYDIGGGKGIMCERSMSKAASGVLKLIRLKRGLLRNIEKLNGEYGEAHSHYSSEDYWRSVFEERRV